MANTQGEELAIVEQIELGATDERLDDAAKRLWRKAQKAGTWDPADVDFSQDVSQYKTLEPRLRAYLERFCAAFYNAEENVAEIFCPWVMTAPTMWQRAFLATQLVEEYKHTDLFGRFFSQVIGHPPSQALANPVHDTVKQRGEQLLDCVREGRDERESRLLWLEAIAHYMGVIEGVQANAGYQIFRSVFAEQGLMPGLSAGFLNIQRDEGRHVGFGLQVLRHYGRSDRECAERIRGVFERYLPEIRRRYGQRFVAGDGQQYDPPSTERGLERLMALYERRMRDIFGNGSGAGAH
jgi:ribonucleoside-diphosphate reductase beta chain